MNRHQQQQLARRARTQGGLVTTTDLLAVGAPMGERRSLVRRGSWQTVLPGVLAPAGLPVDRALRERAAMLWLPAYGALSHTSAARRHGIWVPDDPSVWVTVPYASPVRSRPGVEVVRTRHLPSAWRTDGRFRWTGAARTMVDLAMILSEQQLTAALLSAVRLGRTTVPEVERATGGLDGRAGLQLLRRVTRLWDPTRESMLEDSLHGDVCAVAPGYLVVRQHRITNASGLVIARTDVAVPQLRVAFEADGLAHHSTDLQIAHDQHRDRRLLAAGWQTCRFREGELADHSAVRRDVAAILARRARESAA